MRISGGTQRAEFGRIALQQNCGRQSGDAEFSAYRLQAQPAGRLPAVNHRRERHRQGLDGQVHPRRFTPLQGAPSSPSTARLCRISFWRRNCSAMKRARSPAPILKGKPGLFELASGGTIFLDEIGEMALSLQAKLLTFLDDQSFTRLGGTKVKHSSCAVIAATNQDLLALVTRKAFRRDLHIAWGILPCTSPP